MMDVQLNLKLGRELRDQGMNLAAMNRQQALQFARRAAAQLARVNGTVTSDDVRRAIQLGKGRSNGQNWIGSIFKTPEFVWTGQVVQSALPGNHARLIRVWRLR
jgi:hypothetical protein